MTCARGPTASERGEKANRRELDGLGRGSGSRPPNGRRRRKARTTSISSSSPSPLPVGRSRAPWPGGPALSQTYLFPLATDCGMSRVCSGALQFIPPCRSCCLLISQSIRKVNDAFREKANRRELDGLIGAGTACSPWPYHRRSKSCCVVQAPPHICWASGSDHPCLVRRFVAE